MSSAMRHLQTHITEIMANREMTEETREAPHPSLTSSHLFAAANTNDRFGLLEDDSLPASNLTIAIHPIFGFFNRNESMKQMLRLASHLIAHDSVLTFFVPLLYGRTLVSTEIGRYKSFLSDPLITASETKRKRLIKGVRQALRDLAHTIKFSYADPVGTVYARTLVGAILPYDTEICCSAFQQQRGVRIEIADRIKLFYRDQYEASSKCAQFRQDFHLAVTLVHEIVHAVGVMRRGNLDEPYVRADYFETEWGYAWENFMFGCVINPHSGKAPALNCLMRKVWADSKVAMKAGGKQYSDVSMSYIAQWFREKTWDVIAKNGPSAIPLPVAHFRIQQCRFGKVSSWRLATTSAEVKRDIEVSRENRMHSGTKIDDRGCLEPIPSHIHVELTTMEELQRQNVKPMLRVPRSHQNNYASCIQSLSTSRVPPAMVTIRRDEPFVMIDKVSSDALGTSRKRPAEVEIEVVRATKIAKVDHCTRP
jgi:hypothetical protein